MTTEASIRDQIAATIAKYPGLHLRAIAREVRTSVALVEYHAEALAKDGELELVSDGGYLRAYAPGTQDPNLRPTLHLLRHAKTAQVVLEMLAADGAITHTELVTRTGFGKSTLSFHLKKLMAAKVVEKKRDGFAVIEPELIAKLLRTHKPTRQARDAFGDLWSTFYDR